MPGPGHKMHGHCHRPPLAKRLQMLSLKVMLVAWIIYNAWYNLICECRLNGSGRFIVDKVDMWLSFTQNVGGIYLENR